MGKKKKSNLTHTHTQKTNKYNLQLFLLVIPESLFITYLKHMRKLVYCLLSHTDTTWSGFGHYSGMNYTLWTDPNFNSGFLFSAYSGWELNECKKKQSITQHCRTQPFHVRPFHSERNPEFHGIALLLWVNIRDTASNRKPWHDAVGSAGVYFIICISEIHYYWNHWTDRRGSKRITL